MPVLLLNPHRHATAAALDAYATAATGLSGMVAYWRMDSAASIGDASGNGYTGTFTGTPTLVTGMTAPWQASDDAALDFGGSSHGTVAHDAAFALARGTLSFYFKASAAAIAAGAGLLGKDQSGATPDDQMALRLFSDGSLRCYFQNGGATLDLDAHPGIIQADTEYHVTVCWDEVAVWLLLDGRVVDWSREHTTGLVSNTLDWRFGIRTFDDAEGDVVLDEVALYDRRLSWSEIDLLSEYVRGIGYEDGAATVTVNTVAEIQTEMAAAGPGDIIEVATGTYTGVTVTCTNDGVKWNPWVIRPASGATVTLVDADITLQNQWAVIDGLAFQSSEITPDRTSARYWRVTRCTGTQLDEVALVRVYGMLGRGDHNDFSDTDDLGGAARPTMGFKVEVDQNDPDGSQELNGSYCLFDHNHFHDTLEEPTDDREMIQLGSNGGDGVFKVSCTVYRNLWDATDADNEVLSIKSRGHLIAGNTYLNMAHSGTSRTGSRHGGYCWFESEWLEDFNAGSGYQRILNADNVIIGSHFVDAGLRVWGGECTAADFPTEVVLDPGVYPAADNTLIIGCTTGTGGEIVVGHQASGHTIDATGTTLYESATATLGPLESGTVQSGSAAPIPYTAASKLTSGDVGPAASDPLVPPGYL